MNRGIIKKIVAVGISFTMTFGMAVTSFATDPNDNTNSPVEGTGTTIEHLEKKVINIAWPTTASTDNFSFVMDAEGLIQEAQKYKGAAVTLPDAADDTHVYFKTAEGVYDNTSLAYEVINKSSHKVNISATATASLDSGAMIDLVDTAAEATGATTPKLYLGIIVDSDTKAINTEGTTASADANGVPTNFDIVSQANGSFTYELIATPDDDAWAKVPIKLTGAVSKVTNIGDVKAPKVTVTWKYTDPDATTAMYAYWDASAKAYWIGMSASAGFTTSATEITALTFAGVDVKSGATLVDGSDGTTVWVKLPWSVCTAAGVQGGASSYDIALTLGGVNYEYTVQ